MQIISFMLPQKTYLPMSIFSSFHDNLDQRHPLYILSHKINWQCFDDAFSELYSKDKGRPAKPIRMMVGLLLLKHLRNISGEDVVFQWSENAYYQYFCGEDLYRPKKSLQFLS